MISIEPLGVRDLTAIGCLANDAAIHQTSGIPLPCTHEHILSWIDENRKIQPKNLTYVILANNTPVGCCALNKIKWLEHDAELSYWVGKVHWGKKFGGKAAELLCSLAFQDLGFTRLNAHYLKNNNYHSARILTGLGFKPCLQPDSPVKDRFAVLFPEDSWTYVELIKENGVMGKQFADSPSVAEGTQKK